METKETKKEEKVETAAPEAPAPTKRGGGSALKIGIGLCLGCLVLLILLTVGGFFAGGLAFKNLGLPFLKKAAEEVKKEETFKKLQESQEALKELSQEGITVGTKLPEGFPTDFPLYPGAKVESSLTGEKEGKEGFLVNLETSDDKDKVVSFYKTSLPQKGWEITASLVSGDGAVYTIQKAGVSGAVTVSSEEGKTTINIALGSK